MDSTGTVQGAGYLSDWVMFSARLNVNPHFDY